MLKNKIFIKICISILVVVIGLFIRVYKFENQVFFDWDQNRDYGVISSIAAGNITLLGPIAKGEGGFFLGPLYYYLVLPAYLLKSGDPLSLPLTSVLIDVSMIAAIIYLLSRRIGWVKSITLSILWSFSWFLIVWSRVSWNVALIPIWTLCTMVSLYDVVKYKKNSSIMILAFLAGISWHIHASLIPLIPILVLIFFKEFKFSARVWLASLLISLVPLLPLFLFDLRHDLLNIKLIESYFTRSSVVVVASMWQIINDVIFKLGKNTVGIFSGAFTGALFIGYAVLGLSIYKLFQKDLLSKIASLIIILITILSVSLRDLNIPEYYLSVAYLPTVYLVVYAIFGIFKRNLYIIAIFLGLFLYANITKYSTNPGGYAYNQKVAVVKAIAKLNTPVNIRYELSLGREGGLVYLLSREGVVIEEGSPTKVVITDKVDMPVKLGDLMMTDLVRAGSIKAAIIVLE